MSRFLVALIVAQAAGGAQFFADSSAGFSMTIPDGFVADTAADAAAGRLGCWTRTGDDAAPLRLCITRLDGTLPRESEPGPLEPGMQSVAFSWKGFEVPGVRSASDAGDAPTTAFQVLVPLRAGALRLTATGPTEREEDARAILTAALATIEGESNWLASTERAERTGEAIGQIGAIVIAIGVGMWIMQRRQKKAVRPPRKPGKS